MDCPLNGGGLKRSSHCTFMDKPVDVVADARYESGEEEQIVPDGPVVRRQRHTVAVRARVALQQQYKSAHVLTTRVHTHSLHECTCTHRTHSCTSASRPTAAVQECLVCLRKRTNQPIILMTASQSSNCKGALCTHRSQPQSPFSLSNAPHTCTYIRTLWYTF